MQFSDKTYNILKWLCLIAIPAFATLLSSIGSAVGMDMTKATLIISAIATFIGALIGVSNSNYNKNIRQG